MNTVLQDLLAQALNDYHKGDLERAAQRLEQAIQGLQQALVIHPQESSYHQHLGLAYQMQGNLKQALRHYHRAQNPPFSTAQLLNALGHGYRFMRDFKAALTSYQQALNLEPELVEVYYNLGAIWAEMGAWREAIQAFEAFLARRPQAPEAPNLLCHMGRMLASQNQHARALQYYELALKISPDFAAAYNQLGLLFLDFHCMDKAELCFGAVLKRHPQAEGIQMGRAYSPQSLGQPEEAAAHLQAVLEMSPEEFKAHLGLSAVLETEIHWDANGQTEFLNALAGQAGVLEKRRAFEEAFLLLQPVVEQGIYHASVANFYGRVCLHLKKYSQGIEYIQKTLNAQPQLHFLLELPLCFRLGELYDRLKQAEKAFAYFVRGNALKPQSFDREEFQTFITGLMETFNADYLAQAPRISASVRPIFIVGMPRSGTTLAEQILCSHPQVYGVGEVNFMAEIGAQLLQGQGTEPRAWLALLQACSIQDWQGFAQQYLAKLATLAPPEALRVTDKMPANFLYLGLIQILFPQATIVHCRRHPLDTCLSCFSQDFLTLEYTNHLEHLAHYYHCYLQLMAHWEQVLSLPILHLQYEDLVADPEPLSRQLLAHCGLDWDDKCLSFYATEREVKTASYEQVRQPIYRTSVGRYQAYEPFLEPIARILGL